MNCLWDQLGIFCFLFFYGLIFNFDYTFIIFIIPRSYFSNFWAYCFMIGGYQLCLFMIIWSHLMCVFSDAGRVGRQRQRQQKQHRRSLKKLPPIPLTTTCPSWTENPNQNNNNCDSATNLHFIMNPVDPMDYSISQNENQQRVVPSTAYHPHFPEPTVNLNLNNSQQFENIQPDYVYELDWTYCKICHLYRPPGAHHCEICGQCILRMDHHCPWINNCVGQYNQKYFLQFTAYTFVGCIYSIIGIIFSLAIKTPDTPKQIVHIVLMTLASFIFGIFSLAVIFDQLEDVFNDEPAMSKSPIPRDSNQTNNKSKMTKNRGLQLRKLFGNIPVILWLIPYPFKSSSNGLDSGSSSKSSSFKNAKSSTVATIINSKTNKNVTSNNHHRKLTNCESTSIAL